MARELVLITGGAGFIGSNLATRLASEGFEVRMLDSLSPQVHGDDPPTTSSTFRAASLAGEVVIGSVTSRADLELAIDGAQIVVHLAAETGTGQSMYQVARYAEVNVLGTAVLLDILATSEHSVRKVVVASSRAIYGEGKYVDAAGHTVFPAARPDAQLAAGSFEPEGPDGATLRSVPTDEDSRLNPSSVYGVTKLTQEQLVLAVTASLGIAGVALRYQNVYGPGQALRNPYTGILSIFSTLIQRGGDINIFEDGHESRDFVYIDDVVDATLAAIVDQAADGLAINVGSGLPTTVLEVVGQLERAFGRTASSTVTGNYRLGDIRHNVADISRAATVFGFRPRVDFTTGIERFAAWVQSARTDDAGYERSLEELRSRNLLK